jgi:hypothetical protein
MMAEIEWADEPRNPEVGCDKIAADITWISAEPLLPPTDPWEERLAEQEPDEAAPGNPRPEGGGCYAAVRRGIATAKP